jgi:hypothetical protein
MVQFKRKRRPCRVIAYNKASAQGATTHRIHRQRLIVLRSIDYHLLKVMMVKGVLSRVNSEHILPVEINHQQSPRDWIEPRRILPFMLR